MKKVLSFITVFCIMLSLSSCASERVAVYKNEQELNGIKIIETLTFNAKGDIIYQITENMKLDMSGFEQEEMENMKDVFKTSITDVYTGIEGITCTDDLTDGIYTINAVIPSNKETISALSEAGLMEFTGDSDKLSLSITGKSLEESGYVKVEQ